MNMIKLSDVTMKQVADGFSLSFKEKIELAKLLDKLGVSVIELEGIENPRIDSLRIKSVATAVASSMIAVPVQLDADSPAQVWSALQLAKSPRLQVCGAVSAVQMEYLYHKKPDAMKLAIVDTITACKALCSDVEFLADDATRADPKFLADTVKAAIAAGATTVTICDTAGTMLPSEFAQFIKDLYTAVPEMASVNIGVSCCNALSMADACAIASVGEGVTEVKASVHPIDTASIANLAKLLSVRGDSLAAASTVQMTQLSRIMERVNQICQAGKNKGSVMAATQGDTGIYLTAHDDVTAVAKVAEQLGYDLSEDDRVKVYDAFQRIAAKKERVSSKELDAIIASAALQVPPTYKLDAFVITSGNTISSTAHIKLTKNGEPMEGVSIGDGPIDAAFVAIESITGCHYELDDFQLQAVTEGREAMGQTVVKLRNGGKVYSGKGISTDIVAAGIHAYLSALNKIVYEEEDV
jgi:2-isopropylmalate synthase